MSKIYTLMKQQPDTERGSPLGLFSYLVLGTVLQLKEENKPTHGLRITEQLMTELNTLIDPGQVYLTLKRLAARQLVHKEQQPTDKARRSRVTEYSVTPTGEQAMVTTEKYLEVAARFAGGRHEHKPKAKVLRASRAQRN